MSNFAEFRAKKDESKDIVALDGSTLALHITAKTFPLYLCKLANAIVNGEKICHAQRHHAYFIPYIDCDVSGDRDTVLFYAKNATQDRIASLFVKVLRTVFPQTQRHERTPTVGIFSSNRSYVRENGKYKTGLHVKVFTEYHSVNNTWVQKQNCGFVVNSLMMFRIVQALRWELQNDSYFEGRKEINDILDESTYCGTGTRFPGCAKPPRRCKLCPKEPDEECSHGCQNGYYHFEKDYHLKRVFDFSGQELVGFINYQKLGNTCRCSRTEMSCSRVLHIVRTLLQFSIAIYNFDFARKAQTLFEIQSQLCTLQGDFSFDKYQIPHPSDFELKYALVNCAKPPQTPSDVTEKYNACKHPPSNKTPRWRPLGKIGTPFASRAGKAYSPWKEILRDYDPSTYQQVKQDFEEWIFTHCPRYRDGTKKGVWVSTIKRPPVSNEDSLIQSKKQRGVSDIAIAKEIDRVYRDDNSAAKIVWWVFLEGTRSSHCANLKKGLFHGSSKSFFQVTFHTSKSRPKVLAGKVVVEQRCWSKKNVDTTRHRGTIPCKKFRSKPRELCGTDVLMRTFMPSHVRKKQVQVKRPGGTLVNELESKKQKILSTLRTKSREEQREIVEKYPMLKDLLAQWYDSVRKTVPE